MLNEGCQEAELNTNQSIFDDEKQINIDVISEQDVDGTENVDTSARRGFRERRGYIN